MLCWCERLWEVVEGNIWINLHQSLVFLQDLYDVLNLCLFCQQSVLLTVTVEKKKYGHIFPVTSSIWPINTNSLTSLLQVLTGDSCNSHKKENLLNRSHYRYVEANNVSSIWLKKKQCCTFFWLPGYCPLQVHPWRQNSEYRNAHWHPS